MEKFGQTKKRGKRMACRVCSQKNFFKSWNSGQRHHSEGGRVEESDRVETLKSDCVMTHEGAATMTRRQMQEGRT
jgi:hypothetical protein